VDPGSAILRLGFRKWHERELIKCHAALVTCLLCGLTIVALLEPGLVTELGWKPIAMVAVIFAAGVTGWFSWRAYITGLVRAERYAQRSHCPGCSVYGRFTVIASGMDSEPEPTAAAVAPLGAAWLRVQCNECGTTWRMPE